MLSGQTDIEIKDTGAVEKLADIREKVFKFGDPQALN